MIPAGGPDPRASRYTLSTSMRGLDMRAERIKELETALAASESRAAAAAARAEAAERRVGELEAEAKAVDDALARQTFDEWEGTERQQMAAVIASDMRHIAAAARRDAARALRRESRT